MTLQQLKYVITIADCGSMNEAAKQLYLSQPSLSETVMSLEEEIGVELFIRTNRGIRTTVEGEEFLSYARQVVEQYQLLDDKYISHTNSRKKFCVSMQHYTFAVKAFVVVAKEFGFDEYEFAVRETKTAAVIEDVKNFKSEIGILYRNDFNAKVLDKLLDKMSWISTNFLPVIPVYISGTVIRWQKTKDNDEGAGGVPMPFL